MNLDGFFLPKAIPNRWGVIGIGVVCCNIGKEHAAPKPFVRIPLSSQFSFPIVTDYCVANTGEDG